jgi:hypothetical protein
MTDEIIQKVGLMKYLFIWKEKQISSIKLQDKASVLTQLRKQRGKHVPEDLTTIDEMKKFRCSATHTVRLSSYLFFFLLINSFQ